MPHTVPLRRFTRIVLVTLRFEIIAVFRFGINFIREAARHLGEVGCQFACNVAFQAALIAASQIQ